MSNFTQEAAKFQEVWRALCSNPWLRYEDAAIRNGMEIYEHPFCKYAKNVDNSMVNCTGCPVTSACPEKLRQQWEYIRERYGEELKTGVTPERLIQMETNLKSLALMVLLTETTPPAKKEK